MSSINRFKMIVGVICTMSDVDRGDLVKRLDCDATAKWSVDELLGFIAYEHSNLGIASVALKALKYHPYKSMGK